jgi:hypothetical protein
VDPFKISDLKGFSIESKLDSFIIRSEKKFNLKNRISKHKIVINCFHLSKLKNLAIRLGTLTKT